MACGNGRCNRAVVTAYNNTEQAFVAAGTQIQILGNVATGVGSAVSAQNGGFRVNTGNTFRFSYDVVFAPSAAGIAQVQLYKDGTALPCAFVQETVADGSTYTLHAESVLNVGTCCNSHPIISAQISGVAGTISHVNASAIDV